MPAVAVNLWYHVGSANERDGRTGFAHLFEHMLFQGSAHVGANEHFELIQRAGGTLNGSTWLERTNYYETVPSNQLALALWLEADRMGDLLPAMTQAKLDTQRDVVKNERRWSVDNQPYGTTLEKLQEISFPVEHPFHHSLIGSMEDLSEASLEDVAAFFATYYVPDNAVLTVCGDFEPSEARRLITEYFGPIPRGMKTIARPDMTVPNGFRTPEIARVEDNVGLRRLFLATTSPVFGSEGYYAGSVCAAILGMGKSSRLFTGLVRENQIAAEVSTFTLDLAKGSDLFVVDVTALPEVSEQELVDTVEAEVERLAAGGVTQAEVDRASALILTELVKALETASERADRISMFATYFGDPDLINHQAARYRAVSAEAVTDFARTYLRKDRRSRLLYVPRVTPVTS
ncbi:MAG: insulinase family protein [Gemmatimonadota bacterium]|nr:insulinase family protein [Gemmatimonadota bacterium]